MQIWILERRSFDRRSLDSETVFDCAGQQKKITAIEKQMGDPSFWNNQESAHQVIAQLKSLKVIVDPLVEAQQSSEDLDALRDRMVPARSTRATLAIVETGAVDAGIVYRTDAMSSSGVRVVLEVPVAEGPAIAYPAALTTLATNPKAAERLLAYLQGPDARVVFERAGFIVPEAQS